MVMINNEVRRSAQGCHCEPDESDVVEPLVMVWNGGAGGQWTADPITRPGYCQYLNHKNIYFPSRPGLRTTGF
ncbi:hypothetical protein M404DRAFT_998985 [Pisolithus tinctorius Marx 270]|uniref:Uncharacterized protein n=1 Tax=Pisolithus tinctorius Marx 270 TaxID=870435 RepID=A0A0C3PES4_PISTI|nr:hypothetical protein M404DRAFT_998985 [Pisolithus tinctorius Marx 270]